MATKNYKCTDGKIAYLSANTQRVFKTYITAWEDARDYLTDIKHMHQIHAEQLAANDVYIVFMWLDKD